MENSLQILSEIKNPAPLPEGTPIAIHSLQVAYDYTHNREILLTNAENCASFTIRSVYFQITCYDDAGDRLGELPGACIRGLNAAPGTVFGKDAPIVLPFPGTCKVELSLQKVVFADSTVWRLGDALTDAPKRSFTALKQSKSLHAAQKCAATKEARAARVAAERAATKRKARAKAVLWIGSILLVITALIVLTVLVILPASRRERYDAAEALIAEGKYTEAIAAFHALGDFSDSEERIRELKLSLAGREDARFYTSNSHPGFTIENGTLSFNSTSYQIKGKTLLIPDYFDDQKVTALSDHFIATNGQIEKIELPPSVQSVGASAFADCKKLTTLIAPGLVNIGNEAFSGCIALTTFALPETVTFVGSYAFQGCTSLKEITLPEGLYKISDSMFLGCTALTRVNCSSRLTTVGDSAFAYCNALQTFKLPDRVTTIGNNAFLNCTALTELSLPAKLTSLGDKAFSGCTALTELNIGGNLKKLAPRTFLGCTALAEITLPSTLTQIGYAAFQDCNALATVYFGGSEADWAQVDIQVDNTPLISAQMQYVK